MSHKSQLTRIADVLEDGAWHCTSQFYGDFISDPRRRMIDLKERGFILESRPCKSHPYHNAMQKEWRSMGYEKPESQIPLTEKPKKTYHVLIDGVMREVV